MNHDEPLKISDEQLSAFLDAELPDAEMEIIREQLIEDEELANRMAELAIVDQVVAAAYANIDSRPLPDSITQLLTEDESVSSSSSAPKTAEVIQFPLLKKMQKNIQAYVAIAASVALVIGFGITQMAAKEREDWQSIAQILEHTASGVEMASTAGAQIKTRATFVNKEGNFCRQFSIKDTESASENIACRKNNQWHISTSIAVEKSAEDNMYQTATGGSVLDEKIETMADGDFFDAQAESDAISQHWATKK